MPLVKKKIAQASVDFMMSYGIALIIIFIAISIIYKVSVLNFVLSTSTCTASPGFQCEAFALNKSGVLLLQLSQATGGTIIIKGAACSSQASNIGTKPAFGNVNVNSLPLYYPPNNAPGTGITVYSDSSSKLMMYCYSNVGVANGILGNGYIGYIWLNYTIPYYGNVIQQIAALNVRYT
ncbi:MAG: hypothetical protein ABSD68_02320 [Candidatus Micrarchaeales archaeon]|jgi:hypothetical protein